MNNYQINAKLSKADKVMGASYMIQAHNIQSAYAKALNYWKEQDCKSKIEILEIKKTDGTLRINI